MTNFMMVFRTRKQMHMPMLIGIGLALFALCGTASAQDAALDRLVSETIIYRDNYGVPHVYSHSDAGCVFGFAYASAEDNFWQLEDNTLRALGRVSEVYGDRTFADDKLAHTLDIPHLARQEYQRSSAR